MINIGIAHVFEGDKLFFKQLKTNGINIKMFSISAAFSEPDTKENCNEYFPDCLFLDMYSINHYSTSEDINNSVDKEGPFNYLEKKYGSNFINQLCRIESQYISMSERLSTFEGYSTNDRIYLFWNSAWKASLLLELLNIEKMIFGGIPHSFGDALLMEVSAALKLPTYVLQDYPGVPYRCIVHKINHGSIPYNMYKGKLDQNKILDDYDMTSISAGTNQLLSYQKNGKLIFKSNKDTSKKSRHYIYKKQDPDFRKQLKEDRIKYPAANKALKYLEWWDDIALKNPKHIDEEFSVLFLNAEPESTVNPGFGVDNFPLLSFIRNTQAIIATNKILLVKEHPAMFNSYHRDHENYLEISRSQFFRETLISFPKIKLVSSNANTIDLIKDCESVITANGSVAYEAIMSRKPVIGLNPSSVSGSKFFININKFTNKKLKEITTDLRNQTDIDIAKDLISISWPGSPNGSRNNFVHKHQNNAVILGYTIATLIKKFA